MFLISQMYLYFKIFENNLTFVGSVVLKLCIPNLTFLGSVRCRTFGKMGRSGYSFGE
jgi:hypothetical protein